MKRSFRPRTNISSSSSLRECARKRAAFSRDDVARKKLPFAQRFGDGGIRSSYLSAPLFREDIELAELVKEKTPLATEMQGHREAQRLLHEENASSAQRNRRNLNTIATLQQEVDSLRSDAQSNDVAREREQRQFRDLSTRLERRHQEDLERKTRENARLRRDNDILYKHVAVLQAEHHHSLSRNHSANVDTFSLPGPRLPLPSQPSPHSPFPLPVQRDSREEMNGSHVSNRHPSRTGGQSPGPAPPPPPPLPSPPLPPPPMARDIVYSRPDTQPLQVNNDIVLDASILPGKTLKEERNRKYNMQHHMLLSYNRPPRVRKPANYYLSWVLHGKHSTSASRSHDARIPHGKRIPVIPSLPKDYSELIP